MIKWLCLLTLTLASPPMTLDVRAAQGARRAPVQGQDRYISVNGLRMHYLEWGDSSKPPFIMLHGIARIAHTFDHLAPRFLDRYHVFAIDMRGHGDTDWHPGAAYLVEDYVKDIEAFVSQLGLKDLTLLGNSTGGRVVQVYAGLHPDLVSKLIVEDVGPERPRAIADNFARQVKQEENGWASEEELLAELVKRNRGISEDQLRAYAHYGTKRRADGRLIWKRDPALAKGFVETELWRYVRNITCPTIYILGGASTIVPAEAQAQLKQTIKGVTIVTMPGLGHYPDEESPDGFMAIADRFLATNR